MELKSDREKQVKKMRLESLEHLCAEQPPEMVAKLVFEIIDQSIKELRLVGVKIGKAPGIIILNGIEYPRELK